MKQCHVQWFHQIIKTCLNLKNSSRTEIDPTFQKMYILASDIIDDHITALCIYVGPKVPGSFV